MKFFSIKMWQSNKVVSMKQKPKKNTCKLFMANDCKLQHWLCQQLLQEDKGLKNEKENTNEVFWGPTLLMFLDRHDFQSCNSPFCFYKCVWVFLQFAKKLQNPFDMVCISQCVFKVAMTWKWYGYYIKFLRIPTFASASWHEWLLVL